MNASFDTTSSTPCGRFRAGTLGAFLESGKSGWPSGYEARLDGAVISIASSALCFECQKCSCRIAGAQKDVNKIRIIIDLKVERDGEEHILHVEELFPAHIMEVLEMTMDEDAPARVRRTIVDTLLKLHADLPIDNLLANCIAPMRLYEPLLNALLSPPTHDSMAQWLGQELPTLLFGDDFAVEIGAHRVRLLGHKVALKEGFRERGEVKLTAEVAVECQDTEGMSGQWKSRATLFKPTTTLDELPAPDASSQERIHKMARRWREHLTANITRRIQEGRIPIMLSDVAPELPLLSEISETGPHAA